MAKMAASWAQKKKYGTEICFNYYTSSVLVESRVSCLQGLNLHSTGVNELVRARRDASKISLDLSVKGLKSDDLIF